MKIVFLSTFLNHHQLPLCRAFFNMENVEFKYIAVEAVPQESLELGYADMNNMYDFVIKAYAVEEGMEKAVCELKDADVIITVVNIRDYLSKKDLEDKLIFLYLERIFKRIFDIEFLLNIPRGIKNHTLNGKRNFFALCTGAYVAPDLKKLCAYRGRKYKWGYFTEVFQKDKEEAFRLKDPETVRILWVGRFITLKRPGQAVAVAKALREKNYNFRLDMIGRGELEEEIQKQVREARLDSYVTLLGAMPADQVRRHMDQADIFLFTSNRIEGWGAVLNEAMDSRCAVVANKRVGAAPFLIKHGQNGLLYNGTVKDLTQKTESLVEDRKKRRELGENAYRTMHTYWNADVAAEHFVRLSQSLLSGDKRRDDLEGPCGYIG